MTQSLDRWLDMADGKLRGGEIPCILNGGNDDIWEIDDIIEQSPCVSFAEGKVLDLGGFHLVSMGWTNPTPWDTFREAPEDELAGRSRRWPAGCRTWSARSSTSTRRRTAPAWTRRPRSTTSCGPMHGGAVMKPVGSKAVRDAILKHQPMLSVHGHIHESRGVKRMGRTLAINPGSVYGDGVLQGAVLDLNAKKGKVADTCWSTADSDQATGSHGRPVNTPWRPTLRGGNGHRSCRRDTDTLPAEGDRPGPGWSVRDSMIYACLATNFVTLGIYEFTFAGPGVPQGPAADVGRHLRGLGLVPGHRVRGADRHDPPGGR